MQNMSDAVSNLSKQITGDNIKTTLQQQKEKFERNFIYAKTNTGKSIKRLKPNNLPLTLTNLNTLSPLEHATLNDLPGNRTL